MSRNENILHIMASSLRMFLAVLLILSLGMSVCSADNSSAERQRIADDFAGMILECDKNSAAWDDLLEAVGAYVDSRSDEDRMTAIETCYAVYDELWDTIENYTWESPSEEYQALLDNEDISAEDYKYMAMWAESDAMTYAQSLDMIEGEIFDVYYGDVGWDDFVDDYEQWVERQLYNRQFGWYMYVNYWFAEWTGDDLAYVQETIVDALTSYNIDGLEWDDDRSSIEMRANAINDSLEQLADELEEEVEEAEAELEAAGYSDS